MLNLRNDEDFTLKIRVCMRKLIHISFLSLINSAAQNCIAVELLNSQIYVWLACSLVEGPPTMEIDPQPRHACLGVLCQRMEGTLFEFPHSGW
jgi:hypothetical protein